MNEFTDNNGVNTSSTYNLESITVRELNAYIKTKFMVDDVLNGIYVSGEISNYSRAVSGHMYFTLKDEQSQVKAVMFKQQAVKLNFIPQNGMKVLALCNVSVYERDGIYQLYVESLQPGGVGIIADKFRLLKEKLRAEGFFDDKYKKPLLAFPKNIAVITSKTGAVFHDIANVLERRYPIAVLTLIPAQVQGVNAIENIVNAIKTADEKNFDVIILARGGGSLEDLNCFNTLQAAQAVFDCKTPIISAIGHETDFTITDFTADLRASTPTAAAELAVPDINTIKINLEKSNRLLYNYIIEIISTNSIKISSLKQQLKLHDPKNKLTHAIQKTKELKIRLNSSISNIYQNKHRFYGKLLSKLDALSPLSVLKRGYSITKINDNIILDSKIIKIGDIITTKISNGEIESEITKLDYK